MAAPKPKGPPTKAGKAKEGGFDIKKYIPGMGPAKVPVGDVAIFSRQFSTMINAGLPVLQCLAIISDQAVNPSFKKVINSIKDDIGSGGNLSDSMAKHPGVFDELYTNMIRSGELGGVLDTILERLSI